MSDRLHGTLPKADVWLAPAKLNLFLHVTGKRPDGYHDLQTVFQIIDWYDELCFQITDTGQIRRIRAIEAIPESDDLTLRAANMLKDRCYGSQGVTIDLTKKIPIGSGLGGGSSDAATTLLALNYLWGLNLDVAELMEIGQKLGADVPVFLRGKNAWAQGRGDVLSDISLGEKKYLVIVPDVKVSTHRVFQECRESEHRAQVTRQQFHRGDVANTLQASACRLYKDVAQLIELLSRRDTTPRMSGSGGAVFIDGDDYELNESILCELPKTFQARVCTGYASTD